MSEFSVGDRVRVIGEQPLGKVDVGAEGTVVDFSDSGNDPVVQYDDTQYGFDEFHFTKSNSPHSNASAVKPFNLEPIPEEGENNMENVDAIAVEVDDVATLDYLKKLAKENGFTVSENAKTDSVKGTYGFTKLGDPVNDEMTFHCISCRHFDGCSNYLENHDYKRVDLDSELGKVKEFLEQDPEKPTPTLNGYEAEINGQEVSVGCWSGSYNELRNFQTMAETIGVASGTVTVSGEQIDIQELYQFIEEVKEAVENE